MDANHEASIAFDMLAEPVRRWIWHQGWSELRGIQEEAIPRILRGGRDLIIAAGTASGKTEAAFLPIVSATVATDERVSFSALYLAPLKALINDQFRRIEAMCADLDVPVVKWHGDVSATRKAAARRRPDGLLLMTPESLEALLMRRADEAARLFAGLRHVVIDEMHAFLNGPRGYQVQSLLERIERLVGRPVDRVGLSATLADMSVAARFLRPSAPERVEIIDHSAHPQEVRIQLRGYLRPTNPAGGAALGIDPGLRAAVGDIFEVMRERRGLIFAGSRQKVETVTLELKGLCEENGLSDRFFAHHGSLARDEREDAEQRLRDESRPGSIVATTTLEMGIDVGRIEAVAQIGPGATVSGMKQRIGRSGRREGQVSTIRVYVVEDEIDERTHPVDMLRLDLVQSIAMLNLMLQRFNEPPEKVRVDLSTMLHQVLALIAQHSGITAATAWSFLVESRVFPDTPKDVFIGLLRRMAAAGLIEQTPDGLLLPAQEGEALLGRHHFYGVFKAPDEFRVVSSRGKALGMIPTLNPIRPGQRVVIAGRMWQVTTVTPARKEVVVIPARAGKPPSFLGEPAGISGAVAAEMRSVLESDSPVAFVDQVAAMLLAEARESYRALGIGRGGGVRYGEDILLFPWVGAAELLTLSLALSARGVSATVNGVTMTVPAYPAGHFDAALQAIASGDIPSMLEMAAMVKSKATGKYDGYLDDHLLTWQFAAARLDASGLQGLAAGIAAGAGKRVVFGED